MKNCFDYYSSGLKIEKNSLDVTEKHEQLDWVREQDSAFSSAEILKSFDNFLNSLAVKLERISRVGDSLVCDNYCSDSEPPISSGRSRKSSNITNFFLRVWVFFGCMRY